MKESEFILKHGLEKGNPILTKLTKHIRGARPKIPSDLRYTIFEAGEFAQIWIKTKGCAYSKAGNCTCCDYWEGDDSYDVIKEFEDALSRINPNINGLLIETSGSVLDSNEITNDELIKILGMVDEKHFKKVVIETHINTITNEKISIIGNALNDTEICIESGVESLDKDIVRYSLNKNSVLSTDVKDVINKLHASNFRFIANIMLGVPFVSTSQQIDDAVNSINKLFEIGTDYIMLFPVNIKEYTLVNWMYQNGLYERVNGQMILKVLEQIESDYINRVDVVWYGNRKQENPAYKNDILGPLYCKTCENSLMDFFNNFNILENAIDRNKLLKKILEEDCVCKQKLKIKLRSKNSSRSDRFDYMDKIYTKLEAIDEEE